MKKSRYSLFVALALAAISTSACEDTVSLSVKCDGTQDYWAERNEDGIIGGKCNGGVVGPVEFNVELALSNGEKAIVCNKDSGCDKQRYILSATDDKRIVANACKEGDIECGYCCDNDRIAKCTDKTNEGKTKSLCGDEGDKNTSYQCKGTSVIVQKCESGCVDGKCGEQDSNHCADGKYRCSDGIIQICENSGWKDAVGAQLCDSAKIWKCNDAGVAEPQSCGEGAACKDGKCTDHVCDRITDSGLVCKGGKVGKCENGNWIESKGNDLCEDDKILYCKNGDGTPEPVGCYSEGDITSVCKGGKIDDSGCGNGKECNNSECKPKKYTCTAEDKYICANSGMLYDCNGATSQEVAPVGDNLKCEDSKVVWCKQEDGKHTANITECSPNDNNKTCSKWCTECNQDGNCTKCDKPLERCADNLQGKTVCSNSRNNATCDYCYNNDFENKWVDESKLGCGCVPNEYKKDDDNKNTVCYKGKVYELNSGKEKPQDDKVALSYNTTEKDKVWEFAFYDSKEWAFYNCYNNTYKPEDKTYININCCKKESFFIKQTGYKYYQIESCKEIHNIDFDIAAFQFSTALNDALIGKDDDFLQNDIACLNVKNDGSSKPTMLIKDKSIQVNDDGAVYRAFECLGGTECNSSHKQLCVVPNVDTTEHFYCEFVNDGKSRIMQLQDGSNTGKRVANCPKDTVLQIRENDTTWRDVVNNDCGTDKTHNLDDFRCYFKDENQKQTT